jgi:predicted nucleotidyltransferase component of viral defense system
MALDQAQHKEVLLKILKGIYADADIGQALGFKGGTAAYLFYGLPRFSVDLDFDLLDEAREDHILERVERIASAYGTIKESRKKRFNLFLRLSYADKTPNIKIEINRRAFGSRFELKSHLGIAMLVMTRADMAAHKLVALYERIGKANRDMFDSWFFLERGWPINSAIIEQRTGHPIKIFLDQCIDAIEKLPDRGILAGMGELLDAKQKTWAKTHLKSDLLFLLRAKREASNA